MEQFVGIKTVRLKGAHDKYLWAEQDQNIVSQNQEGKDERALWRVEIHRGEKEEEILRFKSCFGTYLTASEHRHHGVLYLAFSGRKVMHMLPENVNSKSMFAWVPVIEQGTLKLKSLVFGTYLRGNSPMPPWHDSVSHDFPWNEHHQEWLAWEMEEVRAPDIISHEYIGGPIDQININIAYPDADMLSFLCAHTI